MATPDDDQVLTAGDLAEDEALRRMYRISAERERSFDEKLLDLLSLGRTYLWVEAGFLTDCQLCMLGPLGWWHTSSDTAMRSGAVFEIIHGPRQTAPQHRTRSEVFQYDLGL